jgi:hypothetical protein
MNQRVSRSQATQEAHNMRRIKQTTLLLLLFLCVPCGLRAVAADDAVVELPFAFEKGYVIVQAKVKGDQPIELALMTGLEHSAIDGAMLEKYKLPAYYTGEGPVMEGGHYNSLYSYTTVPDLHVGELKLTSMTLRLGTTQGISQRVGRPIFGVLGADFCKGRIIQLDPSKKLVRFLPHSPADALKGNKTGGDATGLIMLPMRPSSERVVLPVVEKVAFGGKEIKMLVDTGAVTVVSLSSTAAKQVGLSAPPEKGQPRMEKVALRLADYELPEVPVTLYPKGSEFDRDMKEFGAVAGTILLQNFIVTFDFRSNVVILEHI